MSRAAALFCLFLPCLMAGPLRAESVRVASFNAELQREGPGLLLRDIERGEDKQIAAAVEVIARAGADVLALQGIDWDFERRTLAALAARLEAAGAVYPYRLALRPNRGLASGLDLDGDGKTDGPGDAQGFGHFSGQGGMAVLSRFPILAEEVADFSALLWRDLPGALLPVYPDGQPFPSAEAQAAQLLSSTGHWAVPVALPDDGTLTLLTFHAAPPVFDGAEDRNGRRNHDEIAFWQTYLDGAFGTASQGRFVIAGDANLDPERGEGRREAIRALLADPRLQDPRPQGADTGTATVEWQGPGRLRVDYLLPSSDWTVEGSGVLWPAAGDPFLATMLEASRHRLVWVDLRR